MASGGKKPVQGGRDEDVVKAAKQINEKPLVQQLMEQRATNFLNWENSAEPKDILAAPGMSDYLDIYGYANDAAKQKQFTPAQALAGPGSANYAKQVDAQQEMNRYNTRAGGLSQAFAGLKGEAYGQSADAIQNDLARKQAYSAALGNYNNNFYQRPQKPPLWQQIAGVAMQGLQTGAMMAA